ncbi:ADAM family mig-17-like isoform X2 [Biomphalaria pfeifferi]|uniref:ADAM family mig-17-like isoform X2 n=1 Tax=Biomphalaria pfeifferi TaxID=112525 RepID=A0AAD8F7X0_BIOPF|nr:ADAM family mig-17-like isoform X2 [Biomphalaria pfeifferi]
MVSTFILILCFLYLKTPAYGQVYKAEGYFVVDDEVVQSYIRNIPGTASTATKRAQALVELQKDIDFTLSEVNKMFATLQPTLSLEVYLRKLDILSVNVIPVTSIIPGTTNGVQSDKALTTFESWLQAQNSYSKLKYDFAFLWTGYEVYGSAGSYTGGFAHIGKICDSKLATGVAEFSMTYQAALTTAHEIAHILGSDHGGAASNYLMAALLDARDAKRWFFSTCSALDIKEYILTLTTNCLLTTDSVSTKQSVSYGSYTGQMMDPDVICQRAMNKSNSYLCKPWSLYNNLPPSGDNVCSQIYCAVAGTPRCSGAFPTDGMVCDSGKRCIRGKCTTESTAPTNSDSNCTLGDQKVLEVWSLNFNGTCQGFFSKYGSSYCYQSVIQQRCCKTCKAYYTGRTGCEYGDRYSQCNLYSKPRICPWNRHLCCGYCYGSVGKRSLVDLLNKNETQTILSPNSLPKILNETVIGVNDVKSKHIYSSEE